MLSEQLSAGPKYLLMRPEPSAEAFDAPQTGWLTLVLDQFLQLRLLGIQSAHFGSRRIVCLDGHPLIFVK